MTDLDLQNIWTYAPTDGYAVMDNPPDGAMCDGSTNTFNLAGGSRVYRGEKVVAGKVGGRTMWPIDGGYGSLVDIGGTQGIGSIFNYISRSLFAIGQGTMYLNGVKMQDSGTSADFVASSNLQLSPYPYSHIYTAGMAEPDAPQVVARTPDVGTTGLFTGVYSFKIARVRSTTGGRSIASVTSSVLTFSGQTVRMTFPALDSNGQDRWAIFGTKTGFGGTGVHYLVQEIADSALSTIDGVTRSYEFSYTDSDLLPTIAYIDDYPPPAGSFGGRLDNYALVIGCYTNAIACSLRNFPESFNPEHLAFLPKAPTAVLQDQMGAYIYISTESSVHALSVAPSTDNPMILQTLWNDTGVANAHNWCSVEGVIYAFTSRQGAVTMDAQGRPSNEFALFVAKKMRTWDPADVCVFHCPDLNMVIYTNGSEAYGFNYQVRQWSAPAQITNSGTVVSGVVQNRRLYICLLNAGSFNLYQFDEQPTSGTTAFKIVSPDKRINGRANVMGLMGEFSAPNTGNYTFAVGVDGAAVSKTLTHTAAATGLQNTVRSRWFLARKNLVRVEFAGTATNFTNDCFLDQVLVFGTVEDTSRL